MREPVVELWHEPKAEAEPAEVEHRPDKTEEAQGETRKLDAPEEHVSVRRRRTDDSGLGIRRYGTVMTQRHRGP